MEDNNEQKEKMYSMDLADVKRLLKESTQDISLAREFIKYHLNVEVINDKIIALLCEFYSCCYVVVREISISLKDNVTIVRKSSKSKELVFTKDSIVMLETSIFARYLVLKKLLEYNVSFYLN